MHITKSEKLEKPPPYSDPLVVAGPSRSTTYPRRPAPAPAPALAPPRLPPRAPPEPQASVTQIHLSTGNERITGTFYIDPAVPSYTPTKKKGKGKKKKEPPHASFQSKKGDINLVLAPAGDARRSNKANVFVSSKSGDISLRLLGISENKPRVGLEVENEQGDIQLYLPRSFSGAVRMSTKKGGIRVLPALAAAMQTLKSTDEEVFILLGGAPRTSSVADLCEIHAKAGKLIVGLDGEDKYIQSKGFWETIGDFFSNS